MRVLISIGAAAALAFTLSAADADTKLVRMAAIPESKIVSKQQPAYPADALDHHIQGVVKISVRIGTDGRVEQARLISGHPLLAPAAVQAVRHWVFEPSQAGGHAVRVATRITFSFTLDASGKAVVANVWPTL